MRTNAGTERLPGIPGAGAVGLARGVLLALAGAALLAASASVQVPMWPVPMTMQTLAVLLLGAGCGAGVGAGAVGLYVGAAALGLPVLAGGAALGGPTFGYLVGFALAAAAVGWLVRRGWGTGPRLALALLAGNALLYVPGLLWLDLAFLHDAHRALALGLLPFVPGDAVKFAMAWMLLAAFRRRA